MGRMNWTRAAKEGQIRRYGAEPLRAADRTLLDGKLPPKVAPAKAKKPTGPSAKPKAAAVRGTATQKASRPAVKKKGADRIERAGQPAGGATPAPAAPKVSKRERRRAETQARLAALAAMTPEERQANEKAIAERASARMRRVVVERRPVPGRPRTKPEAKA
jgi:hypothetical protein